MSKSPTELHKCNSYFVCIVQCGDSLHNYRLVCGFLILFTLDLPNMYRGGAYLKAFKGIPIIGGSLKVTFTS